MMNLQSITTKTEPRGQRILLYGPEGVGKTTFASRAPNPIFICSEDGLGRIQAPHFPQPKSWEDVLEAIAALTNEKHDYRTLCIDSLDWLEPLCWEHCCTMHKKSDIEDFGYGRGYSVALDQWRLLLARLGELRTSRKMHIITVAHSHIRKFSNPEGEDYDRYELKLHAKAAGLWKEWCDVVLFGTYETFVNETGNRVKGVCTGRRVAYTTRTAAYDAKNRHDLPADIDLSWQAFAAAMQQEKQ